MKEYFFYWKTEPSNCRVYHSGKISIKSSSLDEARNEAEKKIRSLRKNFIDVPLKITEIGEKE